MDIEKIHWEKEFSIGNDGIDHDHKKIIKIYNGIVDSVSKEEVNIDECAKFLSEMTDYALSHFKKEESYMQQFSYPKFKEHKHYHMEYLYEVSLFNLAFSDLRRPDPLKVLKFLREWWTNHIQNIDREYEEYRQQVHIEAHYGNDS